MNSHPLSLFSRVRAVGAALIALAGASTAEAQVDLVAQLVNGPGMVHIDQTVLVTINVGNLGDPLVGTYTSELILSDDFEIGDADDLVVATDVSSSFVTRSVQAYIPFGVPDVQHFWALRVTPADGETVTNNNIIFGSAVNVISTDLVLDDPTPIDIFVSESESSLPPIPVVVSNGGTAGSILIFNVFEVTPVPWLSIDPTSSFAIAGQDGNELNISIDHTLLTKGVHTVTLRFRNFQNVNDVHDLVVTVKVGAARIVPGDRVFGLISTPGDVDEVQFTGLEGTRLALTLKALAGNLKTTVTIVDPDGDTEKVLKFKPSKSGTKKVYKLKRSGEYTLQLQGKGTSQGVYQMKTKAKLPKSARARKVKMKGLPVGGSGFADALMLPGGTLEFSADPNSKFIGPVVIGFTDPSGAIFDVSSFQSTAATGEVAVEGLPINETGRYLISVSGFGGSKKEKVKLSILPFQPPAGTGKIYLK